jgi:hypothetical protein
MRRQLIILAACAAAAAPLVACGGADPGAAHAGATPDGQKSTSSNSGGGAGLSVGAAGGGKGFDRLVKFSQCMRAHGVPQFPDPKQQGNGASLTLDRSSGVNPDSAEFKAAQQACRAYAPGGGTNGTVPAKVRQQALAFSACMRKHGVPNFPDPQFTGGGVKVQATGLNPQSPQFKAAQQACQADAPIKGG